MGVSGEENSLLSSEFRCMKSPTLGFSQLLHEAAGFLLNTVLNVPLPHAQVPQGHEGEAPGLLPLRPIAEKDSYKEGKQKRAGRPGQGGGSWHSADWPSSTKTCSNSCFPPSTPLLPKLNVHTCTPTKSSATSFSSWETPSSRKLLTLVNQGFFHCFVSMQHHLGPHAQVHCEHRAVDF